MSDLEEILISLYASGINISISWIWDGDIDVKLGDPVNGYRAEGKVGTVTEIADWLRDQAVRHYPEQRFRKAVRGALTLLHFSFCACEHRRAVTALSLCSGPVGWTSWRGAGGADGRVSVMLPLLPARAAGQRQASPNGGLSAGRPRSRTSCPFGWAGTLVGNPHNELGVRYVLGGPEARGLPGPLSR